MCGELRDIFPYREKASRIPLLYRDTVPFNTRSKKITLPLKKEIKAILLTIGMEIAAIICKRNGINHRFSYFGVGTCGLNVVMNK